MRLWLAIRIFFLTLFKKEVGERVEQLLLGAHPEGARAPAEPAAPPEAKHLEGARAPKRPVRSEAVTLLATLQREARFVDFIKEPLDGFDDAQVGAVARDVHRDCAVVLDRIFGLAPVTEEEGAEVELPAGFDAERYRLVGNVSSAPPFRGRVTHHGWQWTRCELPQWSGSKEAAKIVAPVEVEIA